MNQTEEEKRENEGKDFETKGFGDDGADGKKEEKERGGNHQESELIGFEEIGGGGKKEDGEKSDGGKAN